jgi:hypothetical protein
MANRFWVTGGNGNWNSTTNWSTSTGGASGASVPSSSDAAIFDASSGAGTAVLDISPTIQTLNFSGFTGTFNFQTNNISVNSTGTVFTGSTAMTVLGTPVVNCTNASATSRTISPQIVTEANSISFNITAGTGNITVTTAHTVKDLNFTGFSGAWAAFSCVVYGNLVVSATTTISAGGVVTFSKASGIQTFTSNNVTFDRGVTVNGTGTLQLQDNLTMGSTRTFTLTAGTLDLSSGNRTLSTGIFSSNNSNTRSIAFGTGNVTLTQNAATIWNTVTSTNFSVTGTPTVNVTYAGSTGTRTINGGAVIATSEANSINFNISAGSDTVAVNNALYKNLNFTGFSGAVTTSSTRVYGNLTIPATVTSVTGNLIQFAGTSGTQTVVTNGITIASTAIQIVGGSTVVFNDALTATGTQFVFTLGTIKFKSGVTSTISGFIISGTTQKFLQSTTPGSQATLSQASGTVDASYLTVQDINAVGGATWNAFVNQQNVDAGNNDGWDFGISPIVGSYEYTYQLRSFTQPRRF